MRVASLLEILAPTQCAGCGRTGRVLCEGCVAAIEAAPPPLIAGVHAAFTYEAEVRRVLHHGKFRDCRSALRALAHLGASRLAAPAGALVVAVPLSAHRARERGYNQADVVAAAFADVHRLRLGSLLTRIRETPAQSTLDRAARRANVAGAFAAAAATAGSAVWLVDDVHTTGATTAAARAALLGAGAARVEVAVLAAVV